MDSDTPEKGAARFGRATWVVSAAVMCSRVLGLAREMVFSALFGSSRALDAFVIAFRAPNLLRDLFAEGALSAAFVTTFSKTLEKDGEKAAWQLAHKMISLIVVAMSVISLIGVIAAPWIMQLMASGFDEEERAFATLLARIMFPFIGIVSLSALVMGVLNSRRVFGIPALASSFFNLGSILGGLAFGYLIDPEFGPNALIGFAIGTLIGGLAQLGIQLPVLFKQGYRLAIDVAWRHPGVRKVLQLMLPAVIAGSAVQINVVVNSAFASHLVEGSVSSLNYAFRLMMLPLGVFGVAVATVALPMISRQASRGDREGVGRSVGDGIGLVWFLTLPCAVGLMVLAEPITSLIYERGRFGETERGMVALALQYYVVGLVFYASIKVVQPAFYAVDKRMVPMNISFLSIGVNFGLNWWFVFVLGKGLEFLALSTGLVAVVNFILLFVLLRRHVGPLGGGYLVLSACKVGLAVVFMGLLAFYLRQWTGQAFFEWGLIAKALWTGAVIGVCAAAYFLLAWLMKMREMRELAPLFQKLRPPR